MPRSEEIDAQLAQLDPPRVLLDAADEIESLQERLGAVEKASQDRVRLENFQQDAEHQARRILRELGRTIDLDEAETLRLRADEPAIIRGLGQRFAQLRGQAEEARKTIARHEDQIKRQEKELGRPGTTARCGTAPPGGPPGSQGRRPRCAARRSPRQTHPRGEKGGDRPGPAPRLEPLGRRPRAPGRPLERHPGSVRIPVPGNDEAAAVARRAAGRGRRLDPAARVPVAVPGARNKTYPPRRCFWPRASGASRAGSWSRPPGSTAHPQGKTIAAFLAEFAPRGRSRRPTSKASSAAMHWPTACAARPTASHTRPSRWPSSTRHRTTRAALRAGQPAARGPPGPHRPRLERTGRSAGDRGRIAERRPSSAPGSASAKRWSSSSKRWRRFVKASSRWNTTFNTQRAAISRALDEVGEPLSTADSDLAEVLEQAEAVIKRHDDLSQRRAKLETKLATARAERATAELSLQAAEAELDAWRTEWSAMMARIGLEAEATPEQAEVFLTKISELLEKLNDRRNHQSRIRGIDRDAEEFARDVTALAARVAPDLADRPAGEQARELAQPPAGRTGRRPANAPR